jgi:hypothetical protein
MDYQDKVNLIQRARRSHGNIYLSMLKKVLVQCNIEGSGEGHVAK